MFASFRAWWRIEIHLYSCDLWPWGEKKNPLKKMYLSDLIQSRTTGRIVRFAFCTLWHPVLKGMVSCYSGMFFRSIFIQVYVFVKNSSGVAMSEISVVNFNLQVILTLEKYLAVSCQGLHMWILEKICWHKNRVFSSFKNLVTTIVYSDRSRKSRRICCPKRDFFSRIVERENSPRNGFME